jgi:hypothetical protein
MEITSVNWQLVMTFLEVLLVGGIFVVLFRFHKTLKGIERKKDD